MVTVKGKSNDFCSELDQAWAFRYLREAKVDLSLADDLGTLETVRDMAIIAMKKAQLAVQHALGQSDYLNQTLAEENVRKMRHIEPPLKALTRMREVTRNLSEMELPPEKEVMMETARVVVNAAESIVKILID